MRVLRSRLLGLLGLCLVSTIAFALDLPALTGRVVDQATILTAEDKSDIAAKSQALEEKSGIQLVVATIPSLQGSDIETYANQLFRTWKLGEAQKNNGVLLLVAPSERKVRIEVGYGLEGTLTDALSSAIISGAIIPRFKNGDFSGGIAAGVDGIIGVLSGDTADWQPAIYSRAEKSDFQLAIMLSVFSFTIAAFIFFVWGVIHRGGHYVKRGKRLVFVHARGSSPSSSSWSSSDSSWSSSDSSSSSSSSDFSGGGGSSGGGGASGSW